MQPQMDISLNGKTALVYVFRFECNDKTKHMYHKYM